MLFNSFVFVYFFVIVYSLYLILSHRYQNLLLLVASYIFYGYWDWRFLGLLFLSSVVDYIAALAMYQAESQRVRRTFLVVSLLTNLGILFTFKYYGFFVDSFIRLCQDVGLPPPHFQILQIVLPVGISFYTFQSMSYSIDVYRRQLVPTLSLLDFLLYVSFFPQLVAGPIERATHLLPQICKPRTITPIQIREGVWLLLLGYFKKLVIADNMLAYTEPLANFPENARGLMVLTGLYAFAFQIYCDFSGYSDIARGLSKLMGIELMVNFRSPYLATSPREFWQRWHISLSTWLRDYLYIPLGGNRHGLRRTCINLMITFLISGLWHGAAWHFVVWGGYWGALLCIQVLWRQFRGGDAHEPRLGWLRLLVIPLFFHITLFGWLLFLVPNLSDVPLLLGNLVYHFEWNGREALITLLLFAGPLMMLEALEEWTGRVGQVAWYPPWLRILCYVAIFAAICFCGEVEESAFIYFQF